MISGAVSIVPAGFQRGDPFMLDERLREDERVIRDTARAQARQKLQLHVAGAYLKEKVDRDVFHEMEEVGLIRIALPEAYGCADARYAAYEESRGARYAWRQRDPDRISRDAPRHELQNRQ